jgi:hypothetical protein
VPLVVLALALALPTPAGVDDDAELEAFLERATVVEAKEIGTGITRPYKLVLELDQRREKAAFKYVEIYDATPRRKPGFPPEREFTDDYHYDRAAYLLDRELAMGMVPVTVLRDWDGKQGAAVAWISDAMTEHDRRTRGLEPVEALGYERQRAVMRVFDALILNTDRNLSNQLVTAHDWKLHLIDHSRSFRRSKELPYRFAEAPIKLPRDLLARLEALDEARVRALLDGTVSRARVRALMARRDLILEKVARDREEYGDAYVFQFDATDAPVADSAGTSR